MIFNIIFKRSLSPTLMHGEDVKPPAHQLSDREDVPCDICHGNKAPSVKSCLVCQASYCEIHLVPHQRDPALQRHCLTDPAIFNTSHLCRKHNKPLTMFCKQDHTTVCSKCTEGDHKHHKIVPMEKESRRVKVREKLLPLPCVFWEGGRGGFLSSQIFVCSSSRCLIFTLFDLLQMNLRETKSDIQQMIQDRLKKMEDIKSPVDLSKVGH